MKRACSASDLSQAIDQIVGAACVNQHLPGLSIAVTSRSELVFARGYGLRNIGESLAADPDTIYSIASISKQFTAAAILQLAERTLLRLDDRLSRYFPWIPYGDTIELAHLLGHTSGIPDYFALDDFDRIGFTPALPREIAEKVLGRDPAFAPGAEYQYSNTGYVLLGAVLECVSGSTYAQYLSQHVFKPLGLTRTGVDDTPAVRANVALGYTSFVLGPWEPAREYDPSWEFGTGGLYSTVIDTLAWNRALRDGRVVARSSLEQMTTARRLTDGSTVNYGFGLSVSAVGGRREIRHTGGLPGTSTDNATYPDDDIDIIVFVNGDGCSTYATITIPILALLLGDPRLRAPQAADPRLLSALPQRAKAEQWIRAAAGGGVEGLPFSPGFQRFLRPGRSAQYASLRRYGNVGKITLVDAGRRDPETTLSYRVDFERGPLGAMLAVRDDGTIANLQFTCWDERG